MYLQVSQIYDTMVDMCWYRGRSIDMGKQIEVDTLIDKSTNGEKGGQNNDKGR